MIPTPTNEVAELTARVEALEKARGNRVLVIWLSELAKISDGITVPLFDQLRAIGHQPQLDIVLFTLGGDVEMATRLVSLIREYCEQLAVLIPHRCLSTGTLIAMGADEVAMTPLSVLGPIDPSRTHPLLPRRDGSAEPEPVSVQDMRHAMQFVREAAGREVATAYSPEAWAQIFTALFDKIHPLVIGAIEQSYALAKLVGRQCLEMHMDPRKDGAKISAIVDRLCDDYKSHGYQISRKEARAIGLKVLDASPPVEAALHDLLKFYAARPKVPVSLPAKGTFPSRIGWIDSLTMRLRCEVTNERTESGLSRAIADRWELY